MKRVDSVNNRSIIMTMKKADIEYRVRKANNTPIPANPVERSRLLKSCQVTRNKLEKHKEMLQSLIKEAEKELFATNVQLTQVENKLKELEPDEGLSITEHALLRYVERYMGVDLQQVYDNIVSLPEEDKTMMSNTIVTVFPTTDDCLNLAGNEKKS